MTRLLSLFLIAGLAAGFAACDAVPSATASATTADPEPFELRRGVVVEARDGVVRLTVDGSRVELPAIEMFALAQAGTSAAYYALTPEQRELYLSGEPARRDPPGGTNCYPDGDWVFAKPTGGGGDPCPPPPPMRLSRDLAEVFYGDAFGIGEHPGRRADWRPAAGGNVYR